jgi:hypothetical protein
LLVSKSMEDEMDTIESRKLFREPPPTLCGYQNWFTKSFVFNLSLSLSFWLESKERKELSSASLRKPQIGEREEQLMSLYWSCILALINPMSKEERTLVLWCGSASRFQMLQIRDSRESKSERHKVFSSSHNSELQ